MIVDIHATADITLYDSSWERSERATLAQNVSITSGVNVNLRPYLYGGVIKAIKFEPTNTTYKFEIYTDRLPIGLDDSPTQVRSSYYPRSHRPYCIIKGRKLSENPTHMLIRQIPDTDNSLRSFRKRFRHTIKTLF